MRIRFCPDASEAGVIEGEQEFTNELVGRAVLCPPVGIHTERRAQSDAPYLL